jgi:dipeptidase
MKKTVLIITSVIVFVLSTVVFTPSAEACTNYLISRGATVDGSTMISYAADSHVLYGELYYTPAADHMEGEMLDIYEWDTGKYLGKIKQAAHTYAVVGLMNEHQVSIGETTWGGRKELRDPNAVMDYGSLMFMALQRAKTAREAIKVMTGLVAEYGYHSSGESISISDANEVWIMEIISRGKDNKGAVWVARRVPDGYVCAHANQARIRQFPLNDPKTCLYARDVISFAREKGYFKGEDRDFSFADAYAPLDFGALRFCEARVWSMFNRVTQKSKAMEKYLDYAMGHNPKNPMPLWIKPDKKLTVRDVMELMRDHFEGTPMDMTKDVGAGPFRLPYRWRPLTWKTEDEKDAPKYVNERAASTQQTGFSFVSQSRSWLPGPIGGIHWFGVDDTYSTVYVPIYCGIRKVPESYAAGTGSFHEFSWESAFWVFNFVSNYAYSRYCDMIQDIQILQRELEGKFLTMQTQVDNAALELFKKSPELARNYLTEYSVKEGNAVVKRWKKLGELLLYKYLDGNVKAGLGRLSNNGYPNVGVVTHRGYPKAWYKHIVKETGDHFKYKPLETEKKDEGH